MTRRPALLAKIHIARKELALTEGDYRALLRRVIKADSAKAATDPQLDAVLREMKRLGWKPTQGKPRQGAGDARQAKATALWLALHRAGAVADAGPAALSAYIARQTGQDIGALDVKAWNAVINGLRGWLRRVQP